MATIRHSVLTAAAALIVSACALTAVPINANAAGTAEMTGPARPAKAALIKLEKSAYEAWKSRDAKFWGTFLSDQFVGWGSFGRLDKASATKEYSGTDCDIKSYALSHEQVTPLSNDVALITHKLTVEGTCTGGKVPASSWAASVYVREGNRWKAAFHAQAAIVDPKATASKPVDTQQQPNEDHASPENREAHTDSMLAVERAVWEAWRKHDGKKIADLTASHISFINIFGVYLATKADALHDWSGAYCDVKSVSITDAEGTMVSPTVGILTQKASADGTCYGQKIGPVWGTSVYVKHGDVWTWTFGINLPAPQ